MAQIQIDGKTYDGVIAVLHAIGPDGKPSAVRVDPTGSLPTSSGGDASTSKIIQSFYYQVTTPFAGASAGDTLLKTLVTDYAAQPASSTSIWLNVTTGQALVSEPDLADIAAISSSPLTDLQLRAAPVATADAPVLAKLVDILTALSGNPDGLASLTQQQIALLTTLAGYNDQVESLLSTVGGNTANLTALLTQLGLNTDDIEGGLQQVRDRLPAALGPQPGAASLSVALASGHPAVAVVGPSSAALATDANLLAAKAALDAILAKLIAAPATEATALDAQSPYGWQENTAGELTAQLRRLPNGQLQRSELAKDSTSTPGLISYIPGSWVNWGAPA